MDTQTATRHESLFAYRTLGDDQVAFYEEQGYLLLGRTLTDVGLDRMRSEAMAAWEAEKGPFDPNATWLENSLLANIHHRSMTARRYYFNGPLVDVAARLVAPNLKGATSQLTFKMRGNTMPFDWHQDNVYGELDPYNALTTLTALDDADEDNGCLWIIPGSPRQGQLAHRSQKDKDSKDPVRLTPDEAGMIPVPMKAGEAICFSCWMLHKSDGNRSRTRDRRILFLRYADADAVEVYNDRKPRLGKLIRGTTRYREVEEFERELT